MTAAQPRPPSGGPRLSGRNFQRLAAYIHDTCGIRLPAGKQTMVEGRLRRRVAALGFADLDDYCDFLFERDGLSSETVALVDAVTTNKTDFFREPGHFTFLMDVALPRLVGEMGAGVERSLKVWSAACSTGAEPYTLAMVLDDYGRRVRGFRYAILGTDICTTVLQTAVTAIFPEEMVAPVPEAMRRRYLLRSRDRREVRIGPELRRHVRFGRVNLMDLRYPVDRDMDLIFCRNILIYFDKVTQEAVLRRLLGHLRPEGYLVVGHTETAAGLDVALRPVATSVFVHDRTRLPKEEAP